MNKQANIEAIINALTNERDSLIARCRCAAMVRFCYSGGAIVAATRRQAAVLPTAFASVKPHWTTEDIERNAKRVYLEVSENPYYC